MGDIDESGRTDVTREKPPDEQERTPPGTMPEGTVSEAPLTRLKVREIKRRLAGRETEAGIARDFRISRTTVRRIRHGEMWADVPGPTGQPWPLDLGQWGEPGGEGERPFPPRPRPSRDDQAPRSGDI